MHYEALDQVWAELTGPGAPFEVEEIQVRGAPTRSYRRLPANVREIWLASRARAEREYMVYGDERLTYGDAFVDEIEAAQPDAMIWDTGALGKPDVLQLAYGAYARSGAEAVICVSNSTVTRQVVHGLEQRGIPAFGPIWDS